MCYVNCSRPVREYLCQADPVLGAHIQRLGELKRPCGKELFPTMVSSIISQLISKKAAVTVFDRVQTLAGGRLTPQAVAKLTAQKIQKCGMSMRKASSILTIAQKVAAKEVDLDALAQMSDEQVIKTLCALPGVGVWTAQMLMIFAMGREDVISYQDLGIRRGMMYVYGLDTLTKKQFDHYAAAYHPYSSAASVYLWQLSDACTGDEGIAQIQG